MAKDYYNILGVEKNASEDELKRAFRKKAHEFHPDKASGDEAKFKEVNEAYQTLSDSQKRAQYDQFGSDYEKYGGMGGGGFGGGFQQGGVNFDASDLGDIFGSMFGGGGGGGRRRQQRGQDIQVDAHISFKDAAFGTEYESELYKNVECETCDGDGAAKGAKTIDCLQCGGSGQETFAQRTMLGTFQSVRTCSRCAGRGKMPETECKDCNGVGLVRGNKKVKVKVPAGISNGETLRLRNEGEPVPHGAGPNGDLYLRVHVQPDKRFRRKDFDVYTEAEIDVPLAALGGKITVETLDGEKTLKIPAGTQPGTKFRLKGEGIHFLQRTGRGDMFVEMKVIIPKKLSKKQKQALEDWE